MRIFLVILLCFCAVFPAFALEQPTRLWGGIDITGDLFNFKNWEYDLNSQARYSFTNSQYETTRNEGAIGYKTTPKFSLWLGYNWLIDNANVNQQHRVWQQALWNIVSDDTVRLVSRTRLEQRKDVYQPQWSVRLRERLQLSFPKKIFNTLTPIVYDELFFNLNNPVWVNNQFINQNRFFLGVGIPIVKKLDMDIGYLNQYEVREPENRMNHIVYVNLNIKT